MASKYLLPHSVENIPYYTDLSWDCQKATNSAAYNTEFGDLIKSHSKYGVAVRPKNSRDWAMLGVLPDKSNTKPTKSTSYAFSLLTGIEQAGIETKDGLNVIITELIEDVHHVMVVKHNIIKLDISTDFNESDVADIIAFIDDSLDAQSPSFEMLHIINDGENVPEKTKGFILAISDFARDAALALTQKNVSYNYHSLFSVIDKKHAVYIKDISTFSALGGSSSKWVKNGVTLLVLSLLGYVALSWLTDDDANKVDPFELARQEALKLQQVVQPTKHTKTTEQNRTEALERLANLTEVNKNKELIEINSHINSDSTANWGDIKNKLLKTPIHVNGWSTTFANIYPNYKGKFIYHLAFSRENTNKTVLDLKRKYPDAVISLTGNDATLKRDFILKGNTKYIEIQNTPPLPLESIMAKLQIAQRDNEVDKWSVTKSDEFTKTIPTNQELTLLLKKLKDREVAKLDWLLPMNRYKLTVQGSSTKLMKVIAKILDNAPTNNMHMLTYDATTKRLTMEIYLYEIK